MCGIAGVFASGTRIANLDRQLAGLLRALHHRGPDDQGTSISGSRSGGLVAARLAILDLSAAGHQPMTTEDGRYTIAFNGEIYNFAGLRAELEQSGCTFRSHGDTEVVLELYRREGGSCVSRLRGMFAFAIWDEQEKTCFLARDPLGIKPLYYSCDESRGLLLFASELRSLLQTNLVPKKLCPAGLEGFFRSGSVPEPYTLIEGVFCLEAGTTILWRDGKLSKTHYWQPRFEPDNGRTNSAAAEQTRAALLDSVSHHFVSDVPVGIFLSGGIDSTAVVALSRALKKKDLATFSISFDDPAFNEGDVAKRTADHFGTRHTDCRLDAAEAKKLFKLFLGRLDQPSIDGLNTFTVSKLAHDHGLKVVLSGLGGDELFGGYPSFRKVPAMMRWSRALGGMHLRRPTANLLRHNRRPQLRRVGSFLARTPSLQSAYQAYRGVHSSDESLQLASHFAKVPVEDIGEVSRQLDSQPTPDDQISSLELQLYMRNQLLRDSDVMSMAWSLELRVPLVDRALFEAISRIPAAIRLRSSKQLLLDAVPEIPEWVWNRPKRGFLFPFQQWLDKDWSHLFAASAAASPVPAQTWYQKWSLFVLERWCELNEVSLSS